MLFCVFAHLLLRRKDFNVTSENKEPAGFFWVTLLSLLFAAMELPFIKPQEVLSVAHNHNIH